MPSSLPAKVAGAAVPAHFPYVCINRAQLFLALGLALGNTACPSWHLLMPQHEKIQAKDSHPEWNSKANPSPPPLPSFPLMLRETCVQAINWTQRDMLFRNTLISDRTLPPPHTHTHLSRSPGSVNNSGFSEPHTHTW